VTASRPAALRSRYVGEDRREGIWALAAVVVLAVAAASAARSDPGRRFLSAWLSAALPASGFAVAGAMVGHVLRGYPFMLRRPASVWRLGRAVRDGVGNQRDLLSGVFGAAAVAPTVLIAEYVSMTGADRPILLCAWLLAALVAAVSAAWSVMPSLAGAGARAVGEVRLAGVTVTTDEEPDLLAAVSIALRGASLGTALVALVAAVPGDAAGGWLLRHPAAAALVGVFAAFLAGSGAEAGCFAAAALGVFGPAAVVGCAAAAVVCDQRLLREMQRLVGPGTAWRCALASLTVCFAAATWTGVLLA